MKKHKGMEALCKMDRQHDFLALTCKLEGVLPIEVAEFTVAQGIYDEPAFI
jgi:hypothetical protein